MRILGIDPGIARCGWAVINSEHSVVKSIDYDCIETDSKLSTEKRLSKIYSQVSALIKKHKPDVLSIEDLFFGANSKTAFVVGQARGVILLAAAENKLKVSIYSPLEVKMAVTGYGRADKNQVAQMVKVILKLEKMPKLDDTTDALAIALAEAFSTKLKSKL